MELGGKMFDQFLEELNRSSREFYQKHQAIVDKYDFTKTFDSKAKVEFLIGKRLNFT